MNTLQERVLQNLSKRRQNILDGNINSIPPPFNRFKDDFIGVEQHKYYLITSATKGAKTQFTSFTFLYNSIMYAYNNQSKIRLKVFYYALEETPENILERFMCYLLYVYSNGQIRIAPIDLRSTDNTKPLSSKIIDLLNSEEYNKIINFFEQTVSFSETTNPTGMYKECQKFAEENGTTYTKKKKYKDDFGRIKEADSFDYYKPNDEELYTLVIVDHFSLIPSEKGMSLKATMDLASTYLLKLRNRYHMTPVVIQQQAFANEGIENIKEGRLRPTTAGLADSKYSSRDCNICLGLFSPFRYELREYMGYDITKFRDNIRFLEVIINRDGIVGGLTALYFDGAVCSFKELPKPNDKRGLEEIYAYLDYIKTRNVKSFFMYGYKKIINQVDKTCKTIKNICQEF